MVEINQPRSQDLSPCGDRGRKDAYERPLKQG